MQDSRTKIKRKLVYDVSYLRRIEENFIVVDIKVMMSIFKEVLHSVIFIL